MIVADRVAELLSQHVKKVYLVCGGADLHLIHAIARRTDISYRCPQTEQAAGFAADAYARVTGFGCAIATSGPGATNLLTAVLASFYDSVPVLYITGQVATFRQTQDAAVRQTGFQETAIVEMVTSCTKYAAMVKRVEDVIPEIEKAIGFALEGRKGPVLVDIPDDIQRTTC